ncbi:MAG: hypothetical protein AB1730_23265 [Myxococcota bacterium]|jgi:hypothetical protein
MRPLLISVTVLALSVCKQEAPAPVAVPLPAPKAVPAPAPKVDPVADLWAWVPAHLDELKAVQTGQEPAADALGGKLDAIDPGLTFELGLGREPFELIISADGKKELEEAAKGAAFLLLEAVVGEFDLETKIGGIQILAAPKRAPAGAKPLADLPGAVDAWPK